MLVQGEGGIGKSRLIRTFRDQLTQIEYHAITLNCSSYHQTSAFYPAIDQLNRTLGFTAEEPHVARQEKMAGLLRRLSLPIDRFLPALTALLGISTDERASALSSRPDELRRVTFEAFTQIVTALSEEQPVLFVTEDAHWIDPTTQDLLGFTLDAIPDRRILMVLTARPEFRPPWIGRTHVSTVSVGRLSRRETEAMIRRVARTDLSTEVLSQLVVRTDGVPLFVEELTRSLLEEESDRSSARAAAVPATLQDALTARLDRLAPARDLIQIAALLGRVFDLEIVRTVAGSERNQLDHALAELIDSGLIHRLSRQNGQAFEFKHALIQEAALSTLVRQRRVALHGRIADALTELRPELSQHQPEVVAHHLQEAGRIQSAWTFWRAAGELASLRSASREAVQLFSHAVECLKRLEPEIVSPGDEAATYLGLSTALMQAEGYRSEKLVAATEAAARAARVSGDASLQWRIAIATAPVFYSTGRNEEFLAKVQGLDQGSLSDVEPGLHAGLLTARGIAHVNRGEYADAAKCLEMATDLLSASDQQPGTRLGGGDLAIVARTYAVRTWQRLGWLEKGLQIAIEGERIGRSLEDAFSLAWAILMRSRANLHMGEDSAALADAEEVIAICRRLGFSARLGNALHVRGGGAGAPG